MVRYYTTLSRLLAFPIRKTSVSHGGRALLCEAQKCATNVISSIYFCFSAGIFIASPKLLKLFQNFSSLLPIVRDISNQSVLLLQKGRSYTRHLSFVKAILSQTNVTVVLTFANPTQFASTFTRHYVNIQWHLALVSLRVLGAQPRSSLSNRIAAHFQFDC